MDLRAVHGRREGGKAGWREALEFLARVVSHIFNKGQVLQR